jgi:hypothetical protein
MLKKLAALVCISLYLQTSFAQQIIPCVTDAVYQEQIRLNPGLKLEETKANQLLRQQVNSFTKKAAGIIYIPVVFHIIHNEGLENISQAQIMDQIRILNEDFRRKNGTAGFSADAASADIQVEFRLAQYDPNGNKHDGINRVKSTLTTNAGDNVKALSYWNSTKYLNVWVVKTINSASIPNGGTILGYAQFPWQLSSQGATDGVIVRSDQIGVVGSGQFSQGGRTLTHEIGHWLGLFHTFQGGCEGGTASDCDTDGDQICDTPPVSTSSTGCNVGQNSCNSDVPDLPDMVRNYMDYSDGSCLNTYTAGQKVRMFNCLSVYRNTIYGGGNNNVSYAGIDPATGNYTSVATSTIKAPVSMDFEGSSFADNGWKTNSFNNSANGWVVNNSVGYASSSSMYMHNFTNSSALINGRDGFQSPEYDLSTVLTPYVEFNYAYAQRSTSSTDSLILIISNDFGMTETRLFGVRGENMNTADGPTTIEFVPQGTMHWRKASINIGNFQNSRHARFRFEFVNRRGNNVYIDNFTISNTATGVEESAKESVQFSLFPNPVNSEATISYELKENSLVRISLYDIAGREIKTLENSTLPSGKQELKISKHLLQPGMYFIRFQAGETTFSHKMLVN